MHGILFIIFGLCVAVSFLMSGMEAGVFALSPLRIRQQVRESVVRLRIQTTRAAASQLNEDEIRGQLKDAFYLLPFQRELLDQARERAVGRDFQGKTPIELLLMYLEGKNVPADRQESLAQYARELMLEADGVGSQLSGA